MINFNGAILPSDALISNSNRGFLYGDAVFETLKIVDSKILFAEDHYFRLMASMRIVRMEIPMNFTLEFFEEEVLNLVKAENCSDSARVRMTFYRNDGGFYLPDNKTVSYIIQAKSLVSKKYIFNESDYEVDLYKDFMITKQLLSTIKTNNRIINVTGSIFAKENDLQNCLLLNNEKNVIEALNGNIFMLTGNTLITPPIGDGCLNGILRKQVLEIVKKLDNVQLVEESISPFDLQKADELFLSNVIVGIQPISKYRKKEFNTDFSRELLLKINDIF